PSHRRSYLSREGPRQHLVNDSSSGKMCRPRGTHNRPAGTRNHLASDRVSLGPCQLAQLPPAVLPPGRCRTSAAPPAAKRLPPAISRVHQTACPFVLPFQE